MLRPLTIAAIAIVAGVSTSAAIDLQTATTQEQSTVEMQQQTFCGDRATMVGKLAEEFRENPMAVGMVDQSAVLEIFVSDEGTWTILATGTDGVSCVLSAGEGWESKSLVIGAGA
jgi:hypothetical protein